MESSIAEFLLRQLASEQLPTCTFASSTTSDIQFLYQRQILSFVRYEHTDDVHTYMHVDKVCCIVAKHVAVQAHKGLLFIHGVAACLIVEWLLV